MTVLIFVHWIAFSIAVGMFADVRRNRNAGGWFLLALIISPLLAGVFLAILRERPEAMIEQETPSEAGRIKPFVDGSIPPVRIPGTRPTRTP
jgi:choline-glycine betaine transporter